MSGPAGTTTGRGRRRDVPLLVFVGVVVLVVVGSLAGAAGIRAQADKPVDVARQFLQALADADATRALSLTASQPTDRTLLTDAVLLDSRRRAPLTAIEATATPTDDTSVDVRYRLGEKAVADHYRFVRVSKAWRLDRATAVVDFSSQLDVRLPLVVNGTPLEYAENEAFPVSYEVGTGLAGVTWGPNNTTTIDLAEGVNNLDLDPQLTDVGRQDFVDGARTLIRRCLAQKDLSPEGCPFGFRQPVSGPRIEDSTVRWQLKGDPWRKVADAEVDSGEDPGTAKVTVPMTFTATCRFENGQACEPQDVTNPVIFAGDITTDPVTVSFSAY